MKLYKLTTFNEDKTLPSVSLLKLSVVNGKESEHIFSLLSTNYGKDEKLLQPNITEHQFKELTGNVKWDSGNVTYLSEYAAGVLAHSLTQ